MKVAILAGAVALAFAGPSAAESWQAFSRSSAKVFMADVDSIVAEGEITSIRIATVPLTGAGTDFTHSVETYQFLCSGETWRTAGMVDYGEDAAEAGSYPEEGSPWEPLRRNTIPAYVQEIACNGARAVDAAYFPTIPAFVEAGRP